MINASLAIKAYLKGVEIPKPVKNFNCLISIYRMMSLLFSHEMVNPKKDILKLCFQTEKEVSRSKFRVSKNSLKYFWG